MAEPPTADERVLAVLRASGVFGSLEEPVLQDLGRFLHLQTIPGGAVVLREGEPADTMFFLVSGRLRVSRRDAQGVLQLYNEIRPGESVGE
ncbi:MAG: cyclic nucleotide-binding domain-containing protein, partial [Rhodoferax sp.]|nr:cyclic nucleotide-binding domain-containing protein [Rhodoferax sp.]